MSVVLTQRLASAAAGQPSALIAPAAALVFVVLAIAGPLIAPYEGDQIFAGVELQPPSAQHLFGTDRNGMDVLSRVLIAPRIDVIVGVGGTALAVVIGSALGLIAGFIGRWALIFVRITDVFQAFPVFILAMAVVAFLGQGLHNIILVIGFVNAPLYARIAYAQAWRLRGSEFVLSARVSGMSDAGLLLSHVLPNAVRPIVTQASVTVGWAILLTAGLSFVGAGIRPPEPEWGSMIAIGASDMASGRWWPAVFPGLALVLAIYSFSSLADLANRWLGRTAV